MKISVVIPAYNEETTIERVIMDVLNQWEDAEIIIVNDASTDDTLEFINRRIRNLQDQYSKNIKVLTNLQNMGHGYSVVAGLKNATGDYVYYIDADRQIDIQNIDLETLGLDSVSGYRSHRNDKLFRKIISFCLKTTNMWRHGMYIKDANCPFKIYRNGMLQELLKELPETYVIPIACLEVLIRRYKFKAGTIETPHRVYQGVRQGFLQGINKKMLKFCFRAWLEIVTL